MKEVKLLEALKSMLMQTPDYLRIEIISKMREEDKQVILKWLDESCGSYNFHIIRRNK